jgi:uncharacterized repeat protein (TIGR03803 family)
MVFSLTTGGTEKRVHSFGKRADGSEPVGSLIDVAGVLYGATNGGGAYGNGTVFSITKSGAEKVLHSFNGTDGANPLAGLLNFNGTLYGTTAAGGTSGYGTVFSITTGGTEKVLHSFTFGKGGDGAAPNASLIEVHGTLYGTTEGGGSVCYACGTVFSITTGGKEKILHTFGEGTDGSQPLATLNYKSGSLFGTTLNGGLYGRGTLFSLPP